MTPKGMTPKEMVDDYIQRGLAIVALSHYWHLQSTSYARHMALNTFYNGLPSMVDTVAESSMGIFGIVVNPALSIRFTDDPIGGIIEFKQRTVELHSNLSKFRSFISISQELEVIATLCDTTLYKLNILS